jgi:hypothetical protein
VATRIYPTHRGVRPIVPGVAWEDVVGVQAYRAAIDPTEYFNDEYVLSKDRARALLRQVLPAALWEEFEAHGWFTVEGKRANYSIAVYSQTAILDKREAGRIIGYSCLQLSVPAPTYDRMIAEYVLLKNDEDGYWKTANIFKRNHTAWGDWRDNVPWFLCVFSGIVASMVLFHSFLEWYFIG